VTVDLLPKQDYWIETDNRDTDFLPGGHIRIAGGASSARSHRPLRPAAPSSRAMPRPGPRVAPATRATLPCSDIGLSEVSALPTNGLN
jgi:hypothetical protein